MELSVFDRIIILNIMPPEADYLTLKVQRKLKEDCSFNEDELEALDFHQQFICKECGKVVVKKHGEAAGICPDCGGAMNTGNILWDREADKEVDIEIGKKAMELVAARLQELSEQKKLTESHLSLCEKFIGD